MVLSAEGIASVIRFSKNFSNCNFLILGFCLLSGSDCYGRQRNPGQANEYFAQNIHGQ
jgi:hypothetical protein